MSFVLAALILTPVQDEKEIDAAIETFQKEWSKHRANPAGRRNSVAALRSYRSDKIVDVLVAKAEREGEVEVLEELLREIGHYGKNEKAINCLFDQVPRNIKKGTILQVCFEGIGAADTNLTRPRVKVVNEYVSHRDLYVAVPAIKALGGIRHKSSFPELIKRLKKAQQDMRDYIAKTAPKGCDGECGITCTSVTQVLSDLQKLKDKTTSVPAVQNYSIIVPAILDTLKSITGKVFTSWQEFDRWERKEGDKFEVIDP